MDWSAYDAAMRARVDGALSRGRRLAYLCRISCAGGPDAAEVTVAPEEVEHTSVFGGLPPGNIALALWTMRYSEAPLVVQVRTRPTPRRPAFTCRDREAKTNTQASCCDWSPPLRCASQSVSLPTWQGPLGTPRSTASGLLTDMLGMAAELGGRDRGPSALWGTQEPSLVRSQSMLALAMPLPAGSPSFAPRSLGAEKLPPVLLL